MQSLLHKWNYDPKDNNRRSRRKNAVDLSKKKQRRKVFVRDGSLQTYIMILDGGIELLRGGERL